MKWGGSLEEANEPGRASESWVFKYLIFNSRMGGKTLKYPKRAKYVPPVKKVEMKEEEISEEEHKRRLELLKTLGLVKE